MLSVTKIFTFEAAHAISNYKGDCQHIHGHSYKLYISITAKKLNNSQMVIDFKDLKLLVNLHILNKLDHTLMLKKSAYNKSIIKNYSGKLLWLKFEPTAEYLVLYIKNILEAQLPKRLSINKIVLYETENSFVEWQSEKAYN